jgi:hypothetical protein
MHLLLCLFCVLCGAVSAELALKRKQRQEAADAFFKEAITGQSEAIAKTAGASLTMDTYSTHSNKRNKAAQVVPTHVFQRTPGHVSHGADAAVAVNGIVTQLDWSDLKPHVKAHTQQWIPHNRSISVPCTVIQHTSKGKKSKLQYLPKTNYEAYGPFDYPTSIAIVHEKPHK